MNALSAKLPPRLTLDDFEEMLFDKPENEKWELISGQLLRSMAGAVLEHHLILDNIGNALSRHFRDKGMPCRAFRESFYLKNARDGLAALPDIMVRCGPIAPGSASIADPVVLIEIVSPSSEGRDRVAKRLAYQNLDSVQDYILVSRHHLLVDHFVRTADGWQSEPQLSAASDILRITALDFEIPLSEIYRDAMPPAAG